jgi:hypothetical protein
MTHQAKIIVVETSHTIQITDRELKPFLEGLCRDFNVRAMAEEMNEEALAEKNCNSSIPMEIASALQIPHRFCDPNRAERAKLEIRQENEIKIDAWLSGATLSDSEFAARVQESYAARERYWLEQLRNLNVWPVLFICGADHVASFCELLKQQGIAMHVAAEDWASNNTVERDPPQAARSPPLTLDADEH